MQITIICFELTSKKNKLISSLNYFFNNSNLSIIQKTVDNVKNGDRIAIDTFLNSIFIINNDHFYQYDILIDEFLNNIKILQNIDTLNNIIIQNSNKKEYNKFKQFIQINDIPIINTNNLCINDFYDNIVFVYNENNIYPITRYYYEIFFSNYNIINFDIFNRNKKIRNIYNEF